MISLKKVIILFPALLMASVLALVIFICVIAADEDDSTSSSSGPVHTVNLSAEVLGYQPLVEKYAAEYDISDYVVYILAIMMVESRGIGNDVMQASESLGLPLNTLQPEASIKQGCKVIADHLAYAQQRGCDFNTVLQAYNYGGGFIDYVATRGGKYSFALAEAYSKQMSGGVKVVYKNEISIPINGGYRYNYGNMFYVMLVEQYLEAAAGDGDFIWPVPSAFTYISSYFGYRNAPINGASTYHEGIDIPVPVGTDVYASKAGTVVIAEYNTAMGYYIIIDHGGGYRTFYCHNTELIVKVGQSVQQGQVISHAGSTGYSTAAHLDFKVEVNGVKVDPLEYVSIPGK